MTHLSFNAQPQAPASSVGHGKKAGACGWALNNGRVALGAIFMMIIFANSVFSAETLQLPLKQDWQFQANHPPQPAFRGQLAPRSKSQRVESITYDYVFQPVVTEGRLLFSSSTEEAVCCLDFLTGNVLWSFHVEGPVRFAPRVVNQQLFFGSDDGHVYCLDTAQGSLIWKLRVAPEQQRCIGNGRVISAWPVRTSVAVADGVLYCGVGLFPTLGTFLCAVDAETGQLLWRRSIPYSPHGEILIEGDTILVATGRTAPAEFRRSDGQPRIAEPSPRRALGGTSLGKINDMLIWGPDESGVMFLRVASHRIADRKSADRGSTVTGYVTGLQAQSAVAGDQLYLVRKDQILAVDWEAFRTAALTNPQIQWRRWEKTTSPRYGSRPYGLGRAGQLVAEDQLLLQDIEQTKLWSVPNSADLTTAVLSGKLLILGGMDSVVVLDTKSGKQLSVLPVQGNARGLTVADGSLLVSTDRGNIYRFQHAADQEQPSRIISASTPGSRFPRRDSQPLSQSQSLYRAEAQLLVRHADSRAGFCLVIGVQDDGLVAEIARQSELFVVAIDSDRDRVGQARDRLTRAGLYGKRVVVHHVTEPAPAYPAYFANLILFDAAAGDRLPYRPSAILELLQPYGGAIALRKSDDPPPDWTDETLSNWETVGNEAGGFWQIAHRGPLANAGQWTHICADPANTMCSGDQLVGTDIGLQWFGPPGAEDVVERHAIAMPPLFKDGKLFVSGLFNTIRCVDAYNGTLLWKVVVPDSTRMMLSHCAGFMAAGDQRLFVAGDADCWMLDVDTGECVHKFSTIGAQRDWGYVATVGNYLLGSDQKIAADQYSYGKQKGGYRFLTSAKDLHSRPTVSDNLFSVDYRTRQRQWTYTGPSAILNSTITVGDNCVFFVESSNPAVLADETGTAHLPEFFARDARIVALDLDNGRQRWSKPLSPLSASPTDEHEHIMFLSYAGGRLLGTRTGHIDGKLGYRLQTWNASTGASGWQQTLSSRHRIYAPLSYGKNGQQSRPSIVNGKVYLLSHITDALVTLDLETGQMQRDPALYDFWIHSKTCAVPTASASGLYFRRDSCYLFDLQSHQAIDLTAVTRPGCWMSIIPAGGLVLMPEASSGCTCGFSLQTSVVLAPKSYLAPRNHSSVFSRSEMRLSQ